MSAHHIDVMKDVVVVKSVVDVVVWITAGLVAAHIPSDTKDTNRTSIESIMGNAIPFPSRLSKCPLKTLISGIV